jgi:hypothetical protein
MARTTGAEVACGAATCRSLEDEEEEGVGMEVSGREGAKPVIALGRLARGHANACVKGMGGRRCRPARLAVTLTWTVLQRFTEAFCEAFDSPECAARIRA